MKRHANSRDDLHLLAFRWLTSLGGFKDVVKKISHFHGSSGWQVNLSCLFDDRL
jgi:hypothetical protein